MSENGPVLRIVRGDPDDVELAALTTVLAAASSSAPAPEKQAKRSWWGDRPFASRRLPQAGEGAWRASGLPS
jgi:hypothetical protein